jgi:hypothetical protein
MFLKMEGGCPIALLRLKSSEVRVGIGFFKKGKTKVSGDVR